MFNLFRKPLPTVRLLPGQVLIKVTEEFLSQLMTRTNDGRKMTVIVGERLPDGTHEPQIAVEDDGMMVTPRKKKLAVVQGRQVIQ